MSVTATPTLAIAGAPVAGALAGSPGLVAVDGLHVTWGRSTVLEQPQPATAALTVLDRSPGAPFARRTDLIGQPLVAGWSCTDGSSGTTFRGRITDASAAPLPGAVAGRGFRVALAGSSVEVDLAGYTQPEGTVWPAETFADRRARLLAAIPAGLLAGGLTLPDRFNLGLQYAATPGSDLDTYVAASVDVSGKSLLELIRALYASTSPLPAVYDPAADRYTFAPRRLFTYTQLGLTESAMLAASPDHGGRYVPASLDGMHLDGHLTAYSGAVRQQLDSRVTRVEVSYFDAAAGDTRTATAATVNAASEATTGRRVLTVDCWHSTAAGAQQLAGLYADVASTEALTPRLSPVGWSSDREPLHNGAHAALLLRGAELGGTLFLGRTWLPQLGQRPLVGVLGSTVTYAAGQWSVDLTPAPTIVNGAPFGWAPVTIGALAAPGVRLRDLDPSVTLGDLAFIDVGAGFTTTTAPGYKGNPLP